LIRPDTWQQQQQQQWWHHIAAATATATAATTAVTKNQTLGALLFAELFRHQVVEQQQHRSPVDALARLRCMCPPVPAAPGNGLQLFLLTVRHND
jgi:hypothetical protein